MNRKSQSAMEFLMTYGWALMIILIVLATLFYLGVFSPKTVSACIVDPPFSCDVALKQNPDKQVSGKISITAEREVEEISEELEALTSSSCTSAIWEQPPNPNQISTIILTSCAQELKKGNKYSGKLSLSYKKEGGTFQHAVILKYSGTVE
ncbi:MAG: hypothetical protein KKG60_00470 [Nanoarchaeota archaeon]|nr:hypothetical protein [Nanoarchaeota archaeon]